MVKMSSYKDVFPTNHISQDLFPTDFQLCLASRRLQGDTGDWMKGKPRLIPSLSLLQVVSSAVTTSYYRNPKYHVLLPYIAQNTTGNILRKIEISSDPQRCEANPTKEEELPELIPMKGLTKTQRQYFWLQTTPKIPYPLCLYHRSHSCTLWADPVWVPRTFYRDPNICIVHLWWRYQATPEILKSTSRGPPNFSFSSHFHRGVICLQWRLRAGRKAG